MWMQPSSMARYEEKWLFSARMKPSGVVQLAYVFLSPFGLLLTLELPTFNTVICGGIERDGSLVEHLQS